MRTEDTDLTGSTPLHAATLTPDVAVARLLLDRGANIEVVTSLGHTPLHLTAVFENEKVAVLLMQRGANIQAIGGELDSTPLHLAVTYLSGVTHALLDRGADLQATDLHGNTPCQLALNRGRTEAERWVERLCLNYTPPPEPPPVGTHWYTETPLHRASYEGSVSEVRALLDQGADIQARVDIAIDGRRWQSVTPLHLATLNPDIAVLELLLDRGADIYATNADYFMAVHFANRHQRRDAVDLLKSRG